MKDIIDLIKEDTRKLLTELNKPNLAQILKFYEIVIDLINSGMKKNKREIYYQSVNVFKKQYIIDHLIKRTTKLFGVSQRSLMITASLKGLFFGPVKFKIDGQMKNCSLLIPDMLSVEKVITKAKVIIVLEKDSIFSFLCQFKNVRFANVLFVCGKGYPCNNTILFLNRLKNKCKIYGLFDFDPYGLHIYHIYKYGSTNNHMRIENITRIGIDSNDVFKYKIDEKELLSLNNRDYKMIEKLKKIDTNNEFIDDLRFFLGTDKKMEMEIFTSKNINFIVDYIIEKLDLNKTAD